MASRREINRLPAVLRHETAAANNALLSAQSPPPTGPLPAIPLKSNNPYASYGAGDSVLPRSVSQEQASSAGKKAAPPRAVFADLSTAFSSITSGSSRSGGSEPGKTKTRSGARNLRNIPGDDVEDSILLEDLEPASSSSGYTRDPFPIAYPQPVLTRYRSRDSVDLLDLSSDPSDLLSSPALPPMPQHTTPSPLAGKPKSRKETSSAYNTNVGLPSLSMRPSTQEYESVDGMLHPRYRTQIPDAGMYGVMAYAYQSSTPVEDDHRLSSNFGSPIRDGGSLPEGSTVGNIYKHYVDSDQNNAKASISKCVSQDSSGAPSRPSALMVRKESRAKRQAKTAPPPLFGLPASRDDLLSSSPYADTHGLLESSPAQMQSSPPSFQGAIGQSRLSYAPPQVVVSHATGDDANPEVDHGALEREISNALRRASGISNLSTESYPLYEDYPIHSLGSTFRNTDYPQEQNLQVIQGRSTNKQGWAGDGFYEKRAIAPQWVEQQQENFVRIPVNRTGHFAPSLPTSPDTSEQALGPFERLRKLEADQDPSFNDWETIDERSGIAGGFGKRCGSSVADTSACDTDSDIMLVNNNYSSTTRIVQHPGEMGSVTNHYQRELKDTKQPVLVPILGEHRINGQLKNSSRTPPARQLNMTPLPPHPVEYEHRHPFRTPPEIMTSPYDRRYERPEYMRHSVSTISDPQPNDSLDCYFKYLEGDKKAAKEALARNRSRAQAAGLSISQPAAARYPPGRKSINRADIDSWQQVTHVANEGGVLGNAFNKTSKNSTISESTRNFFLGKKGESDGPAESRSLPRGRGSADLRPRRLVKGAPGNLYRGVANRGAQRKASAALNDQPHLPSDFHEASKKMSPKSMRKQFEKVYPTNRLRPLSLVDQLSRASTSTIEHMRPGYSIYKATYERKKRETGKDFIPPVELSQLRRAARAEADVEYSRRQYGASRLTPRDLMADKSEISRTCLIICNFCPPLLLLYTMGRLDFVISWYTRGNIEVFSTNHKSWAWRLFLMWCAVILVICGIALGVYFGLIRPRRSHA